MIEAEMFIARTGSDGFAVIIQSVKQDANWFAFSKRLRLTLARLLFDADPAHRVGIRMGVSRAPQHARDSEELLLFADLALLQAREDASQPYQLFSHHLLRQYQRHRQLAEELRAQLSLPTANQLFLCYQPPLPMQPSSRLGAEVLIRWKHPELGFVPPNELVEIAEENGLGEVLCAWILRTLQQEMEQQQAQSAQVSAALQQALEQAVGEHAAGSAGAGHERAVAGGLVAGAAHPFGEELAFVGGPGVEAEARWGRVGPAQALALQAGALRVGQAQAADAVAVGRAPAVVSPTLVRHGAGSARWAGPSRRRVSSCG